MTTQFPTALDSFTNPSATSKLSDVGVVHADQHANANDAIEALEAKVGTDNSTNPNSLDYKARYLKQRIEGWNDLVTPVTLPALASSTTPNMANIRDGVYGYQFDSSQMKECFTNFHMGHDYIPGTMVYPHVHWTTNTNSTGVIRWGVEYTWACRCEDEGAQTNFPQTQILYIEYNVTGTGNQYKHFVNESADLYGIPGTGVGGDLLDVDSVILCRFFRDAEHVNDTYPDPVFLISVDLHYQSDTKTTPLRTPPFK